jgi:hypothetical protein
LTVLSLKVTWNRYNQQPKPITQVSLETDARYYFVLNLLFIFQTVYQIESTPELPRTENVTLPLFRNIESIEINDQTKR